MVSRSEPPFLKRVFKGLVGWRKAGLLALFLLLPFFSRAWELSVGPPLGFALPNSRTIFGNQGPIVPVKVKINELEYSLLVGAPLIFSIQEAKTINEGGKWGGEIYLSYGFSVPLGLNLGGGIYALKLGDFGVRLEHETLVTFGGKYLNYRADGPLLIRIYTLLFSYEF